MSIGSLAAAAEVTVSGTNYTVVIVVAIIALAALAVAGWLVRSVLAASEGTESMKDIARAVQEGAAAYLARQFKTLSIFAVIVFFVLFLLPADNTGSGSAARSSSSSGRSSRPSPAMSACGWRCAPTSAWRLPPGRGRAARHADRVPHRRRRRHVHRGPGPARRLHRRAGPQGRRPKVLEGFGFGAALLAMFMRVGGGIFTKAADVGADLVGKVEQGIPEDDPATPPPSRTTWATTSATAPVWPRTCSSPTR